MTKSDDCAEPLDRPVMLLLWLCARHVCSFPSAGLLWILMKPTHPCSGPFGIPSVLHPSVLLLDAQDDTWVGQHRQGQMEVAGPYYLDGSAIHPEIVELRRAG